MDELGGALRELARTAHAPTTADPGELWQRGRSRLRQRRVTGAAVGAVVAVLLAFVLVDVPEPTVVMPAGEPHAPAIPKNIYEPNRFLAGVSEEGPPGQLAVISQRPGGDENDGPWFGISATTGEYRYLDLPHEASDSAMALSADGRRIAYWVTGPTRKESFGKPDGANAGGPLPDRPTTGVGVYDTSTGRVLEHQVLTDFGLSADGGPQRGLAWLGDDTLVFSYGVRAGSNSTRFAKSYRWSPIGSVPVVIASDLPWGPFYAPALPGDGWVSPAGDGERLGFGFVDSVGQTTGRPGFSIDTAGSNGDGRLTVSGNRVVGIGVSLIDKTRSDATVTSSLGVPRVSVGELPAGGGKVELRGVGTAVDTWFVGWLSPERVLVTGKPGEKPNPANYEPGDVPGEGALRIKEKGDGSLVEGTWLYDVDVVTGRTRQVGVVDSDLEDVRVASDLLDQPMVQGRKPPSLLWALRVPIAAGSFALLAAAAFLLIRRRRRA